MTTVTIESSHKQSHVVTDENQYLTFNLAEEYYGVDILKVQEIKGYTTVTKIPNTPDYFKGVLNLRGTIVPIVDLRMKFGIGETEPTSFTVVVVVNVHNRVMGFLVDAVSDVLDLNGRDIHPPPEIGNTADITFMAGIGNSNDHLVMLLDIDRVLTNDEVKAVADLPANVESVSAPG